jgi:fido (protein-threonine AMPylation protein)
MSSDPYVYPGTTVLKNIPGIRNQERLDRFEADRVGQRSLELIECPLSGLFGLAHLKGIHRYLFQDVYEWAGEFIWSFRQPWTEGSIRVRSCTGPETTTARQSRFGQERSARVAQEMPEGARRPLRLNLKI